ncbi:MAG: vWA domain-containing protein [Bdellovibrionota bacterium]|jgi:Flp pilus assembly protein TadG
MKQQSSNKEAGAYLLFAAISLIVILGVVGLGLDLGKLYRDKLCIQKAADAAIAAGLRDRGIRTNIFTRETDQVGQDSMQTATIIARANLMGLDFSEDNNNNTIVTNFDGATETLSITITYTDPLFLLSHIPFFGVGNGVRISATAQGRLKPANIALVLDYSGSMCCDMNGLNCGTLSCKADSTDSKASHLINAVDSFLAKFKNGYDRISFIPFDTVAEVSAGMARDYIKNWTDLDSGARNRPFGGDTNPSDALLHAFVDAHQVNHLDEVHYVFFTDGAPTAGRFLAEVNNGNNRLTDRSGNYYQVALNPYQLEYYGGSNHTNRSGQNIDNLIDFYNYKVQWSWFDNFGNLRAFTYAPSPVILAAVRGPGIFTAQTNIWRGIWKGMYYPVQDDIGDLLRLNQGQFGYNKHNQIDSTAMGNIYNDFNPYADKYNPPTAPITRNRANFIAPCSYGYNPSGCGNTSGFCRATPYTNAVDIITNANAHPNDPANLNQLSDTRHTPPDTDRVWDKLENCFNDSLGNSNFELVVPFSDYSYGRSTSTNTDDWSQQYYNAAIAYGDMIRDNGGIIHAIGLGPQQPNITPTDFYQDPNDDKTRKDYFLARLALDPEVCQEIDEGAGDTKCKGSANIGEPATGDCCYNSLRDSNAGGNLSPWSEFFQETSGENCCGNSGAGQIGAACINCQEINYSNRYRFGEYEPVNDPNQLTDVFQRIAQKILLSLADQQVNQ